MTFVALTFIALFLRFLAYRKLKVFCRWDEGIAKFRARPTWTDFGGWRDRHCACAFCGGFACGIIVAGAWIAWVQIAPPFEVAAVPAAAAVLAHVHAALTRDE